MDYTLLTELLPLIGQYQAKQPLDKQSVADFLSWAGEQNAGAGWASAAGQTIGTPILAPNAEPAPWNRPVDYPETANEYISEDPSQYGGMPHAAAAIGRLVTVLSRYAKRYFKLAIVGTEFTSLDDVSFLARIVENPGLSKMEIIVLNNQEKPQGMEVFKRLLSLGYIEQARTGDNKRKQAIYSTQAGQMAFFNFIPTFGKMARLIVGDLTQAEQDQLFVLLDKLDAFHHPYYINRQHTTFDELLAHAFGNRG